MHNQQDLLNNFNLLQILSSAELVSFGPSTQQWHMDVNFRGHLFTLHFHFKHTDIDPYFIYTDTTELIAFTEKHESNLVFDSSNLCASVPFTY